MKKVFLLLVVLFSLIVFTGCSSGKLDGAKNISKKDIFSQKEDKYYIYFHKLNCQDCESTNPYVINYATLVKENENCSGKRAIYVVLVHSQADKPNDKNIIYRAYDGSGGQGTDGKFFVDGVTRWEDLYIASTSSLIQVDTNKEGIKVARYVAQGSSSVINSLNEQLSECYAK